jgi:cystathionine beta-lyase
MSKSDEADGQDPRTRLVRTGRDKSTTGPFVNPPVVHASTVLFDSVDDLIHRRQRYVYGRRGTPTSEALEAAVTELESAAGTVLCPSGLSAAATALLACVESGDHVLIVDTVYGPIRQFVDTVLKRLGVSVTYYDPLIGAGIADLFAERTSVVYLEAPGSLTFEMQDVPAIAAAAHERGATVLFDNTWATPINFKPLDYGADIVIEAGTKYFGGHSDLMLGTASANEAAWPRLTAIHGATGLHVGPDDMYLGLRGIRTLAVRLDHHAKSAMTVASWLAGRTEVARVLYPALASDPGHALWKRDMTGASGLFGVVFDGWSTDQAALFIDSLDLFGIGASWGGFESLAVPGRPTRTATAWQPEGALIRLHIGFEDTGDLIADLDAAFSKVTAGQ